MEFCVICLKLYQPLFTDELPAIESGSDLSDEDDEVRGHQEKEPDNSGAISDCNSPEKDKSEEKQPRETQIVSFQSTFLANTT